MARQNHNFPTRMMKQNKGRQKGRSMLGGGAGQGETERGDKGGWWGADSAPCFPSGSSPGRRTKARARNRFFRKEKERLSDSRASKA